MVSKRQSPIRHPDDVELVRRYFRGEPTAIDALVERLRFVPRALATINRRYGRPLSNADLADVAQDVFVVVWNKIRSFEGRAKLESWLYRCAFLEYLSRLSRTRKDRPMANADTLDEVPESETEIARERWIQAEWIERGLDRLPRADASVIRLKHYDSMTFDDIASRLDISANTAKTRYYRGLLSLRSNLGKDRPAQEATGR